MAQSAIDIVNQYVTGPQDEASWSILSPIYPIGEAFSSDGTQIYLRYLSLGRSTSMVPGQVTIWLSDVNFSGTLFRDDFTDQMEESGTITLQKLSNGNPVGNAVVLHGIADSSEPYQWTPVNSAEVINLADTFPPASGVSPSIRIIFNDDPGIDIWAGVAGSYKQAEALHVGDGGAWKQDEALWVGDGGEWKSLF